MRVGLGFIVLCLTWPLGLAAQEAQDLERARQETAALDARREALESYMPRGPLSEQPAIGPQQGPCFEVHSLTITGSTALPVNEVAAIKSRYVPGCLYGADIQALMQAIDGAYAEAGYITSKTYIEPQNIADGAIELTVLEGTVEGVFLVDAEGVVETSRGKRQIATAFPRVGRGIFQLRDVEQGLDQMNRLASVDAKMRLQPGEAPGASNIIVQRLQKDRFRGTASYNNHGSEGTGINGLGFDLALDDAFGLNDTWSLGYSGTRNTNALSFSGSVPAGYSTYNLGLSYSEYLVPLTELAELYGRSRTVDLGWKKMLWRDQTSTLEWSFGLQARRSERFVNDAALTPQYLTSLEAKLNYITQVERSKHLIDCSLKRGLTALRADADSGDISRSEPHAQFSKINCGWLRLAPIENYAKISQDLRVQWAPHALYGAEQMSLGSRSTVRGYRASEAIGDRGIYLRTEVTKTDFLTPEDIEIAGKIEPSAFLDLGAAYDIALDRGRTAAGAGLAISYKKNRFSAQTELAWPLIAANEFDIGNPYFTFKLNVQAF